MGLDGAGLDEVWLVFDGIDTNGRVYLNEAPPPRPRLPSPGTLDHCFSYLAHTLPNPRLPNFKALTGVTRDGCEQASLADPLSAGFSMLAGHRTDKPDRCWLYHNVSAVSNGSGFRNGDWYSKIVPSPTGCAAPPSPAAGDGSGFPVADQFKRYAFPVKRLLRSSSDGAKFMCSPRR